MDTLRNIRYHAFMDELKDLCDKHNVYFECVGYDGELAVKDKSNCWHKGEIYWCKIENRLEG